MWERHRGWAGDDMGPMRPSEIFRRNFYGAFVDDEVGLELRDRIGVDRIMWECDYPHVEAPWPDSQVVMDKLMANIPRDEADLITNGNARRIYRWPKR
jgi:hypothetical protein